MKSVYSIFAIVFLSHFIKAQTFQVDTIQYKGDKNKFINIVILGDGYLDSELGKFVTDANNVTDALFIQPPFSNYRNYFNVFLIKTPSNVSGASLDPNVLIDNYYGSTFWYSGIERLLVPTNSSRIMNVLSTNFPLYDQVLVIVNSSKYGGSGGWIATTSTNSSANEIAFHELGHSFTTLADEYWAGEQYAHEALNMTQQTDLENLRWKNWYNEFGIGLYSFSESPSWYRPHQNCKMRYLNVPFCSVCSEGTIERIHSLVTPLLSYYPSNTTITAINYPQPFKLSLITPIPNTLKTTWQLNGLPIYNNVDSVLLNEADLTEGTNTLVATVEDTTNMLRIDNHAVHVSIITWNIEYTITGIKNIESNNNFLTVNIFPNPFTESIQVKSHNQLNGELKVEVIDMQGKILTSSIVNSSELNTIVLNHLKSGLYIAKIYLNNEFVTSRELIKTE